MSEREFWDALGEIDDGLIEEAGKRLAEKGRDRGAKEAGRGRGRMVVRVAGMAAMAGLVIFLGASHQSVPGKISTQHVGKNLLIQRASEPEKPKEELAVDADQSPPEEKKMEVHDEDATQSSGRSAEADVGMRGFYEASIGHTLLNHAGENMVYSPTNLYLSLGMLAEMGNGNTRQDILSVMGEGDLENARKNCMDVQSRLCWRENTFDSILGHSVWLGEGIDYARNTVSALGKSYCASVFQGAGGRERMMAEKDWLEDFLPSAPGQKDGEATSRNGFDLLSACSVEESWREGMGFDRRGAEEGIFYQRDGRKREVSFMGGVIQEGDVTVAKRYCAADLGLSGGSRLSVYLPREGVEVEEMLRGDLRGILSGSRDGECETGGRGLVQVSLPRFQVSSGIALNDVVKELGLENIFEEEMADFSPLLAEEGEADQEGSPYVGKIRQHAALALDEEGCGTKSRQEAGNGERGEEGNGDGQQDENAFLCNRPFAFIVWSREGLPVLAGMIHTFE